MLREFCVEESLPPHWSITTDKAGHIDFHGERIAASINKSYALTEHAPGPTGELKRSVVRSATRADMLLYVTGAYMRYGDTDLWHPKGPNPRRAFFSTANSGSKFRVLKHFLSRLGCTNIRLYDSSEAMTIPTQSYLSFSPTDEVKAATGIRREVTREEMKVIGPSLKRTENPYFNARF